VIEGRTATRAVSHFDASRFRSQIAAECDFDPVREGLTPREVRRLDRSAQFAVTGLAEALADSGIEIQQLEPGRIGVSMGTAVGATRQLDEEYRVLSDGGRHWLVDHSYAVPHMYDYLVPSSLAAEVAWKAGAEGPVGVISAGCTSGIDAVGHACGLIRDGSADVMVAGAADAPLSPITFACFDAIKATSNRNDDPEHAMRPFDRTRNGFVLGEGAAIFLLEELEQARRRRAHIYAEIAGYASRSNAYHMTGLHADGREMAEAIRGALAQARLPADAVGYVNAHGTATRQNDRHETAAIKSAFGGHAFGVPVSSIKAVTGHSLGGIGAIEIAATTLAIEHQIVPPTANLAESDPELDLDYVPVTARECRLDVALTVGSGFGGFQSAMLLARPERMSG
jgi:act minimal PKS ketosynthase (KS/KS alpha)